MLVIADKCACCTDAILGTTFFGSLAPTSYGRFDQALISMFCVAAGMGWTSSIPGINPDGSVNFGSVFFIASFVVVVNWTLLQICVAVLLDSFIRTRRSQQEVASCGTIRSTLDPLLECLAWDYADNHDLSRRLVKLFEVPKKILSC